MNKTLAFLERLGRDARLAGASEQTLADEAETAGLAPELAHALAARQGEQRARLLPLLVMSLGVSLAHTPSAFASIVFAPDEAPPDNPEISPEELEKYDQEATTRASDPLQNVPPPAEVAPTNDLKQGSEEEEEESEDSESDSGGDSADYAEQNEDSVYAEGDDSAYEGDDSGIEEDYESGDDENGDEDYERT